jgi:hypothetical protein
MAITIFFMGFLWFQGVLKTNATRFRILSEKSKTAGIIAPMPYAEDAVVLLMDGHVGTYPVETVGKEWVFVKRENMLARERVTGSFSGS